MKIKYIQGDIFEAKTQVLVNTVNCKGVMGKGLALEFKKRFPQMYQEYKKQCEEEKLTIGRLYLNTKTPQHWVLNFPTKNHWRQKSKLEYIEKGLLEFRKRYAEWGISSIAFPRLGCQFGGLNWSQVGPMMEKYLEDLPGLRVEIFTRAPRGQRSPKRRKGKRDLSGKDCCNPDQKSLTQYGEKEGYYI